jgi:hypothetical protein
MEECMLKFIQIGDCCSWETADKRFTIHYWSNANRPKRANGSSGGYGMYTLEDATTGERSPFTSKRAAMAAAEVLVVALLACECDNTHQANDTVCQWCWANGRRKWNDPEVANPLCPAVEHQS